MITRRRFVGAATALVALRPGFASAQGYPSRAIRIVVPWPPGGLVDTGGRVVGEALTKALGQSAVVENVPGAAGTLGADQVAKAAPDGHMLLMATSSIAIDVAGGRKTPFDPRRDLVPVAPIADTNNVVIVPAASPFRSVADVIAAAKAKPGDLSYGTPGIGSPAHLFGELFAQTAGVQMLHVPYSRTPAMNDLIGGRLSVMFATIPAATPQIRNGNVRPLAVTGAARFPTLPEVPTVAESGVPGYDAGQWLGVFAPGATPDAVVQRLNAEITKAVKTPAVAQQLQERGMIPLTATPAEFAKRFADDVQKWGRVIRAADIKLE
jgi:tripartite-type tricarboxylate transporter receptor subunit TctC